MWREARMVFKQAKMYSPYKVKHKAYMISFKDLNYIYILH